MWWQNDGFEDSESIRVKPTGKYLFIRIPNYWKYLMKFVVNKNENVVNH